MLTEGRIQYILFDNLKETSLVIPNIYWRNGRKEMDICQITKSGLVYEYEVKTTYSDFLNEFKNKKNKHYFIEKEQIREEQKYYNKYLPNYFYFVCPEGIIKPEDIEGKKSGLIYIIKSQKIYLYNNKDYYLKTIVKATKIHDGRVEEKEYLKIAKKLMWKLFKHCPRYESKEKLS